MKELINQIILYVVGVAILYLIAFSEMNSPIFIYLLGMLFMVVTVPMITSYKN